MIALKTKYLGKNNEHYKTLDSTQKEVWRRYEKGAKSGLLISSEEQTSGIGTHGRVWHTLSKNNITFSFLWLPSCEVRKIQTLPLELAKLICSILKENYNIDLEIKKPNDLIYNKKKIGGILVESKCEGNIVNAIVIGIGINIEGHITDDLKNIATSIKKEWGITFSAKDFINIFCNKLEIILERMI